LGLFFFAFGLKAQTEARSQLPGAYCFQTPSAKATWAKHLPQDLTFITPTCAYDEKDATIYLLAESCGLSLGNEVEFLLLGRLSDRAYEAAWIAWDHPSAIQAAAKALKVPLGEEADVARGLPMARGERFTIAYAPLVEATPLTFHSVAEVVSDEASTPAQNLFARGFPYVGCTTEDDLMPCAMIGLYTGCNSLFGMPYFAGKSATYGLFRAKQALPAGSPFVIALKWQRLPNQQPRVFQQTLTINKATLTDLDALIETLKGYCEHPADVFLDVCLEDTLTLEEIIPVASLLLALEAEGGFTLSAPQPGQLPIRAFAPKKEWLTRETRTFQPWEIEVAPGVDGAPVNVTLCQIEEDWSVEGFEPALTRHCYPNVTAATIADVMQRVDLNHGRIYVAFFYCQPGVRVKDLLPYAEAIKAHCPTQWIFVQ
jgi:hypothetical protein